MKTYSIAVLPGDGIGHEVIPQGLRALACAGEVTGGYKLETTVFPWSCAWYLEHGQMMPSDALRQLADFDAIYFGAVGSPRVPDHVSLWGLLLPIRQAFDQYVNLRPIRLFEGILGPLRDRGPADIDMVCVRENTEGEYVGMGGRYHPGAPDEAATQVSLFTRKGIERVARYAFELARRRRRSLASATKSNALNYSAVLWDDVVADVARDYPDVRLSRYHVDALAARMITAPDSLDVIVASNLFGDILTDLGGAMQGSLGVSAGANLNPEKLYPSLFEPVHGSAPDIAGQGVANPMAAVWAGSMMLDHLGQSEAARLVLRGLETVAAGGPRTRDLGGTATTLEAGTAVVEAIRQVAER